MYVQTLYCWNQATLYNCLRMYFIESLFLLILIEFNDSLFRQKRLTGNIGKSKSLRQLTHNFIYHFIWRKQHVKHFIHLMSNQLDKPTVEISDKSQKVNRNLLPVYSLYLLSVCSSWAQFFLVFPNPTWLWNCMRNSTTLSVAEIMWHRW